MTLKRDFVNVNGINTFYRDTVAGSETVLCLHGRWGRGETWVKMIRQYHDRYHIIAPDQRGHGLSDRPRGGYAATDFAQDMHEFLTKLNCAPAIVIGHSMGARMAAALAAFHPDTVRALAILDEPAGEPDHKNAQPEDGIPVDPLTNDWPTPYPTYQDAVDHLRERFKRETNVRYFLDSLVETPAGYDYLFSRYAMGAISRDYRNWYDLLDKIKCPVMLARGTESWCLSVEEADKIRKAIPNSYYCEITGSDHMVHTDNPEEFHSHLDRFLDSIPG
ncbi:MAG: alpha/beta hydrolase [Candidatus Eisenbacteria bacterium]